MYNWNTVPNINFLPFVLQEKEREEIQELRMFHKKQKEKLRTQKRRQSVKKRSPIGTLKYEEINEGLLNV